MLAQSMHWRRCMKECIPLTDALAQVPHKTPLGMKESCHRQMQWHVCITIPQTLKGTQTPFVVNSVQLHLTAVIATIARQQDNNKTVEVAV